ncbi:hypothetical protein ACJIZ3_006601 [Penstemon smallii]|uniref:Uncharacterized protein n=1 Tax=Penstemon smallii TaxID=265156 RepID=A0ABD3S8C6_9LAMI
MENEDLEEKKSRRARFLVYKVMQKADTRRSKPSWLRVKMSKLKIKIGTRLKKLRKGFSSTMFSAKADFCKQMACALNSCKFLVHAKQGHIVGTLPPVF